MGRYLRGLRGLPDLRDFRDQRHPAGISLIFMTRSTLFLVKFSGFTVNETRGPYYLPFPGDEDNVIFPKM